MKNTHPPPSPPQSSLLVMVVGFGSPQWAVLFCCIDGGITAINFYGLGILNRIICVEILRTDVHGVGSSLRSIITALGVTIGLFINSMLNQFVGLGNTFLLTSVFLIIGIPMMHFLVKETKGIELAAI